MFRLDVILHGYDIRKRIITAHYYMDQMYRCVYACVFVSVRVCMRVRMCVRVCMCVSAPAYVSVYIRQQLFTTRPLDPASIYMWLYTPLVLEINLVYND